jgi:hypothetical protein
MSSPMRKPKTTGLYSLSVHLTNETLDVTTSDPLALLGNIPTTSQSSFRYTAEAGVLVFSDNIYEDGDLTKVPPNDEKWRRCCPRVRRYVGVTLGHVDRASLFTVSVFKDGKKHWQFSDRHVRLWFLFFLFLHF